MRFFSFICFLTFSYSLALCQNINLKANLSGTYRITTDDRNQEMIDVTAGVFIKLNVSDTLEIEFEENEKTIKYRFSAVEFKENDSLNLDFIHYYDIDTVKFSSSCIDGSKAKSKVTFIEKNKGYQTVDELPERITIKLINRDLVLKKVIETYMGVVHGSGRKSRKKWGFSQNTFSRSVTYLISTE
jgi:hypothetical protein